MKTYKITYSNDGETENTVTIKAHTVEDALFLFDHPLYDIISMKEIVNGRTVRLYVDGADWDIV